MDWLMLIAARTMWQLIFWRIAWMLSHALPLMVKQPLGSGKNPAKIHHNSVFCALENIAWSWRWTRTSCHLAKRIKLVLSIRALLCRNNVYFKMDLNGPKHRLTLLLCWTPSFGAITHTSFRFGRDHWLHYEDETHSHVLAVLKVESEVNRFPFAAGKIGDFNIIISNGHKHLCLIVLDSAEHHLLAQWHTQTSVFGGTTGFKKVAS
jgi:hypothetical protein